MNHFFKIAAVCGKTERITGKYRGERYGILGEVEPELEF